MVFWGRSKKSSDQKKSKSKAVSKKDASKKNVNKKNKKSDSSKDIYQWLQTYAEIVGLVEKKGFRFVDFKTFIQESLKSAVSQVDAHSAFFPQDAYKSALESTAGEFSGIGISIIGKAPEDDALVIVDVIQGGPADKAGIKGGDKIIDVAGEKLKNLSTDEVITKLKGVVGSSVSLKLLRGKKALDFNVVRDIVKDQTSACYFFKNQNVYYLSLKMFTETAAKQMATLLKKANEGKCKGIVLDLRRNPGGTLESSIEMAGLFLEKGSMVVSTKDRNKRTVASYNTKNNPILRSSVPIFILIDNFTASAAEILAGCLHYHSVQGSEKRDKNAELQVFLVGSSTFGKGSVQELIPIKNGCAVKLTTMLYYLPGDRSIQAVGISPDFVIKPKFVPADELKWIQDFYGKESSLKHFITVEEVENNGGKVVKAASKKKVNKVVNSNDSDKKDAEDTRTTEEKMKEELATDVQVQASVNMINLLDIAKKCSPELVKTRVQVLEFLRNNFVTDEAAEVEKVS